MDEMKIYTPPDPNRLPQKEKPAMKPRWLLTRSQAAWVRAGMWIAFFSGLLIYALILRHRQELEDRLYTNRYDQIKADEEDKKRDAAWREYMAGVRADSINREREEKKRRDAEDYMNGK